MRLFLRWFKARPRRLAKDFEINERRSRTLDCLSQGPKAHHRKRCSRRRPQDWPERCESRRVFPDAYCFKICDSSGETLITSQLTNRSANRNILLRILWLIEDGHCHIYL